MASLLDVQDDASVYLESRRAPSAAPSHLVFPKLSQHVLLETRLHAKEAFVRSCLDALFVFESRELDADALDTIVAGWERKLAGRLPVHRIRMPGETPGSWRKF